MYKSLKTHKLVKCVISIFENVFFYNLVPIGTTSSISISQAYKIVHNYEPPPTKFAKIPKGKDKNGWK